MKKKDIISIIVSVSIMAVAIYFGVGMLSPKKSATQTESSTTQAEKKQEFTGDIDETTLNSINEFQDYGGSTLDNIGRANPFGPL